METQNFESRKHVLEYDDVMNKQREAVYGLRHNLLEGIDQKELLLEDYTTTALSSILDADAPANVHADQWNVTEMKKKLEELYGTDFPGIDFSALNRHELGDALFDGLQKRFEVKELILGPDTLRYHERVVMLTVLDGLWKDHLLAMDHLKEGIGLRGYAQQDPLVAYKKESFDMFEQMMTRFQEDTLRNLFRMQIMGPDGTPIESLEQLAALQAAAGAPPVAPPPPQLPSSPPPMRMSGGSETQSEPASPPPAQERSFPTGKGPQRQQFAPTKATSGQKPKRRR